jgi:phosphoglycolate phosphatase
LAFKMLCGISPTVPPRTEGRTDHEIMRNLFHDNQVDYRPEYERDLSDVLEQAMRQNLPVLKEKGFALPGAAKTLELIATVPTIVQSVLTGNILPNARVKLGSFGLDRFLDFEIGGFGSDDDFRPRLVPIAQQKAQEKYGFPFDSISTVLVGDTARDVQAGLEGGAKVIGVATGVTSADELRAAGADATIPSLNDSRAVLRVIRDVRVN